MFYDTVPKLLLLMQVLVKLFLKLTVSLVYNNIKKERGGKEDTAMVLSWILLIGATVFLLLMFSDDIH